MKKNYVLLSGLILASSFGFSQSIQRDSDDFFVAPDAVVKKNLYDSSEPGLYSNKTKTTTKAYRDTLFYEDFDGGLPTGWNTVDNGGGNNIWTWDTVYQAGNASTGVPPIGSTTGSNGFMSLPSDFYNSGAGTPTPMDTYFESATITSSQGGNFPNSVYVSYQQYLAYCCSEGNRLVLQVSSDNFATFEEFDATDDLALNFVNAGTADPVQTNEINISCAAAGESSIQIRFLAEGNTRYWWMIDDFAVIEGPANELELRRPYLEFNVASYGFFPFYGQVPYELFTPLPFFADIINGGSAVQTNVALNANVNHLNTPGGGTGSGNVYQISTQVSGGGSLAPLCDSVVSVLTGTPRFVPLVLGDFEVQLDITSDSVDQIPGNESATLNFSTSDTVFARDDNAFGGGVGPGSWIAPTPGTGGGTAPGDRYGSLYILENRNGHSADNIPTSITIYINDNTENIGVEIVPKIWEFDETATPNVGQEVASSFLPYVITSSDTSSFLTLPFGSGSALSGNGLDSGQYIVGVETAALPTGGGTIELANDFTTSRVQVPSTYVYWGHSPGDGWARVRDNPVIRLNMGNLPIPVGLNSNVTNSAQFEVSPNPSNGEFKLNITTEQSTAFNLNVRNMLGQTVYTGMLRVNGPATERLDLSGLEKGVYFVTLENENEKLLKKVVLK